MFNPYQSYLPTALSPLRRTFNLSSILTNAQKTLNIVNQTIPIVQEARPIVRNARTLFKVVGKLNSNNKNNNPGYINSNSNKMIESKVVENKYNEGPSFFI